MHESFHCLGIGHIDVNGGNYPNNIMNDVGVGGSTYWQVYYSDKDILAFNKLYNPSATPINNNPQLSAENLSNHPNPFKPSGAGRNLGRTISYSLGKEIKNPKIEIFNIRGQRVKSFELSAESGEKEIVWRGRNNSGNQVSSGVYFYRLVNNSKTVETKKMLLLK